MKKLFINLRMVLLAVAIIASTNACTDLTEKLYSEIPADQFYQTQDQIDGAVNAVYSSLAFNGNHGSWWTCQEVSSDEMMIPQRGGDWYDGGQFINAAQHVTNANDGIINGSWSTLYKPIATCNRLIAQLPKALSADKAGPLVTEIRGLRAYYYMLLLDQFGNVPLFVNYPVGNDEYATKDRASVYAFVESEFAAVIAANTLTKDKKYGKLNYWSVKALQARLYENAEVYTGTAKWAEAKAAANEIITAGPYKLDETATWYQNNFWKDNDKSIENIFVVPYDEVSLQGFNHHQMGLHYNSQETFNLQNQPWNGYCTLQEFYNSYESADVRKANFFAAGQQFKADGKTQVEDPAADDPDGKPLNFTPEINMLFPKTFRQAGVRMLKFRPYNNATGNLSNDFPITRLAEMYLIRAEASWKISPTDVTALADVNKIRARAGVAPFIALTNANLVAEFGREMFQEGHRRTDEIRFGTYSRARQVAANLNKPADDDATKRKVYPIPQVQLDANPKLRQNTGY